ncbi:MULTISPECIES: super-infection exclusion protein B [Myxococcus]|uniref:super-infection exclusion protein B n=1 Tax=Myxococcus TaxID=32 RepID=UPI0013D71EE2|nr:MULTISPECIES: super-infection exclusion protein B [Myxococcus]NVJ14209.1 super-infection exclusion protein B [Myxococcus sp. AM010]
MAIDPAKWWQFLRESLSAPKVWGFVLLVSCPALLLPQPAAELLGVAGLREEFRPWLGVAAFVATAALLVNMGSGIVAWWQRRQRSYRLRMGLFELSPTEKVLLSGYLRQRTNTRYFHLNNGIAAGLVGKKILFLASANGDLINGFPFNIQPWAWRDLNECPEVLMVSPEDARALEENPIDEDGMPIPAHRLSRRI